MRVSIFFLLAFADLGEANIRPVMIDVAKPDSVDKCRKDVSSWGTGWQFARHRSGRRGEQMPVLFVFR